MMKFNPKDSIFVIFPYLFILIGVLGYFDVAIFGMPIYWILLRYHDSKRFIIHGGIYLAYVAISLGSDGLSGQEFGLFMTISYISLDTLLRQSEDVIQRHILMSLLMAMICHNIIWILLSGMDLRLLAMTGLVVANISVEHEISLQYQVSMMTGAFIGIQSLNFGLSGGLLTGIVTEPNPTHSGWVQFISAPIVGLLLIHLLRIRLNKLQNSEEEE